MVEIFHHKEGPLYIEGSFGCWSKFFEFQLVRLLKIVKLGQGLYIRPQPKLLLILHETNLASKL
jgi:hypothetical protein